MKNPLDRPGAGSMGGASTDAPADRILQFAKVTASNIHPVTGALQYNVVGIGDLELDTDGAGASLVHDDDSGEVTDAADVFCGLGVVGRPLPPDQREGRAEHLEVVCIRSADALVPISARDVRLRMGGDAPSEGTVAVVGYGGGFHSLTPVEGGSQPDGGGTIHVLYCPYDFDADGNAQKAHAITLDPTQGNESVLIAHADGAAISMDGENLTLRSPDGSSWIAVADGEITITAAKITLGGGVAMGANPSTAIPLAPTSFSASVLISSP